MEETSNSAPRKNSPLGERIFLGPEALLRPIWRALLFVFAVGFVLTGLSRGLLQLVVRFPAMGIETFHFASSFQYAVISGAFLLLSFLFVHGFDRRSFRTLGLWFYNGWAREAGLGVCLGGLLIAATVAAIVASGGAYYARMGSDWLNWIFSGSATAIFVLLAAAGEELMFRGYAFQRLVDSVGKLGAVLVPSALFGIVHMNNPDATPLSTANTALAGVLLALAYLKTRGLWMPLGLHWAWNFFQGPVFGLPVSGFSREFQPHLFRAQVAGPEWLTGGAYGPEGSILLTVACIAAIVWLARTRRIIPSPAMAKALK